LNPSQIYLGLLNLSIESGIVDGKTNRYDRRKNRGPCAKFLYPFALLCALRSIHPPKTGYDFDLVFVVVSNYIEPGFAVTGDPFSPIRWRILFSAWRKGGMGKRTFGRANTDNIDSHTGTFTNKSNPAIAPKRYNGRKFSIMIFKEA